MTTSVTIADDLLAEVMTLTETHDRQQAVETALRAYVTSHLHTRQSAILGLVGKGLVDPAYDVRAVRRAMEHDSG